MEICLKFSSNPTQIFPYKHSTKKLFFWAELHTPRSHNFFLKEKSTLRQSKTILDIIVHNSTDWNTNIQHSTGSRVKLPSKESACKVQTFLNKSRFRMQQNIFFESAKCTKLLIAILHYNINVQSDMCGVQCALVCISVHYYAVFSVQYEVCISALCI